MAANAYFDIVHILSDPYLYKWEMRGILVCFPAGLVIGERVGQLALKGNEPNNVMSVVAILPLIVFGQANVVRETYPGSLLFEVLLCLLSAFTGFCTALTLLGLYSMIGQLRDFPFYLAAGLTGLFIYGWSSFITGTLIQETFRIYDFAMQSYFICIPLFLVGLVSVFLRKTLPV